MDRNRSERLGGTLEEAEPIFPAPLEQFRAEQMNKIASADKHEQDLPAIAPSAESNTVTPTDNTISLLEGLELDEDETQEVDDELPPIRQFTSLSTSGLQILDDEDEEVEGSEFSVNSGLQREMQDGEVSKKSPRVLIEELDNVEEKIPGLEDATEEVEAIREKRRMVIQEIQNEKEGIEEALNLHHDAIPKQESPFDDKNGHIRKNSAKEMGVTNVPKMVVWDDKVTEIKPKPIIEELGEEREDEDSCSHLISGLAKNIDVDEEVKDENPEKVVNVKKSNWDFFNMTF